ncbi:hypothetical protein BX616_005163 [Lobosporangium transversale]|nr:hypothetical protein BX616_005163 [Lobosporangium transversale]
MASTLPQLALEWGVSKEDYFLVAGYSDGCVRMWQIVKEEDGQCHIHLKWSTGQKALYALNASIQDVADLSESNRKILEQHGAVGDPTQRPTFQEVNHESMTESSTPFESNVENSDILIRSQKRQITK